MLALPSIANVTTLVQSHDSQLWRSNFISTPVLLPASSDWLLKKAFLCTNIPLHPGTRLMRLGRLRACCIFPTTSSRSLAPRTGELVGGLTTRRSSMPACEGDATAGVACHDIEPRPPGEGGIFPKGLQCPTYPTTPHPTPHRLARARLFFPGAQSQPSASPPSSSQRLDSPVLWRSDHSATRS